MITNTPISPTFAGIVHEDASWHLVNHKHPVDEFVIVLDGCERVSVQGRTVIAPAGSVLFFPRGVMHEEWVHECEKFENIYVGCVLHSPYERGRMPQLVFDRDGRLGQLARWFHSVFQTGPETNLDLAMVLFHAFFLEYRQLSGALGSPLVETVRSFVRSHIADPIGLEDLARVAELSKFHFLRAYRRLTGATPMADVRKIRLEEARSLLLATHLPLKTIASRVGLANQQHLTRLIKSHFGTGTREMRSM